MTLYESNLKRIDAAFPSGQFVQILDLARWLGISQPTVRKLLGNPAPRVGYLKTYIAEKLTEMNS